MKKHLVLIVYLITIITYGQNFSISQYENIDSKKIGKRIRTLLKVNKNTLIVNLDGNKYITISNNKAVIFTVVSNRIINSKKIDNQGFLNCKSIIDTLSFINPKTLNLDTNDKGEKIEVQDGSEYKIELYKEDKILILYSYSPETFIEYKYPYFEKRKIFLENFSRLKSYFYDKTYERIKDLDTLFIYFKKNKKTIYHAENSQRSNGYQENYYFNLKEFNNNFPEIYYMRWSNDYLCSLEKRKFLKKNKEKTVDYNFLKKYGPCDLSDLINSGKKKVFIVEENEKNCGNYILKEVRGGTFCPN
jgi:hypothetical protein